MSSPLFREPHHPSASLPVPPRRSAHVEQSSRRLRRRPAAVRVTEDVLESAETTLLRTPSEGIPPLVDTEEALEQVAYSLSKGTGPVAVDTERAQGYRYGAGAYLLQLRRRGAGSFLIDSHAFADLKPLSSALEEEWILHAADQDLACLNELGLAPPSIFDTEVAARLLGFERFSLGALTEQILGITLEKSHQNEDWSLRPLPVDWLRYAALDVELLADLRENLLVRLSDAGRTQWAAEEFDYELTHPLRPRVPHWRDLKGLGRVRTRPGLAIAKELWVAREQLAQEEDLAPGRILNSKGIVEAALREPKTKSALASIEAFRRPKARKHAELWWRAVARAGALPDPELPSLHRSRRPNYVPPAAVWKRNEPAAWKRLQAMRGLVARAASPLGIAPEVVLEPRVQREVAWEPLTEDIATALSAAGARPWQLEQVLPLATKPFLEDLRKN